jgi:acetyl-CoA carboxylase biotin carboxyl carrier protein
MCTILKWTSSDKDKITMATEIIYSEITGSVWKIQSQLGDVLEPDASIMILESMKMEIPVLVPDGGRLVKLLVDEGVSVKEGQELAVIETE